MVKNWNPRIFEEIEFWLPPKIVVSPNLTFSVPSNFGLNENNKLIWSFFVDPFFDDLGLIALVAIY